MKSYDYGHPKPDFTALTTDALIVFPWDKQVLTSKGWQLHPELESAIRDQD